MILERQLEVKMEENKMNLYNKYRKQIEVIICMILLSIIAVSIIGRFVNLNADFPKSMDWSGDLYTDEGGYARNAIAFILTGKWYVAGDFNSLVNCPVLPLVQIAVFKVFGMSFVSARAINASSSVLLILVVFLFMKKHKGFRTALLCTLILSTNFFFFSFNRLALLETPAVFFAFLSVYLISDRNKEFSITYTILAGLSATLCVLIKYSGVFVLPVLIYIIFSKETNLKNKIYQSLIGIMTFIASMVIYLIVLVRPYYNDFDYFNSGQLSSNLKCSMYQYLCFFKEAIKQMSCIESSVFRRPNLILISMIFLALLLLIKHFREDFVFVSSLIWILGYAIELSIHNYFPPRYYIILIVPYVLIIGCIWSYIFEFKSKKIIGLICAMIIVLISTHNFIKIIKYTLEPKFTYYNMSLDIAKIINADNSPNKTIMGQEANTVAIQSNTFAVNNKWGTYNLEKRIKVYNPGYYLSVPGLKMETNTLSKYYKIELIKKYDVFDNYYTGEPVCLYKLTKK